MAVSASDKASLILNLLGHELAAQLFVGLMPREQAAVLRSMAGPRVVLSETEVQRICREFVALWNKKKCSGVGVLPPSRGSFAGVELPRGARVDEICSDIPDWILTQYLKNQLDSVVSAVLGSIDGTRAASLFKAMPADRQTPLLISLSRERVLDASVLDELEADLEELRARTSSGRFGERVGGLERAVALVQALDVEMRQRILDEVDGREPELAKHLEGELLSVSRLAELLPAHLAALLAQLKDSDVGSFLRGEPAQIQGVYLAALSKRRREDVECLLEPEKKITQRQKAEACDRLRSCAQKMRGEGKILFPWEERLVG